jgi:hypothetical protein
MLAGKYPEVALFNVQFEDDPHNDIDGISSLHKLSRSARDVIQPDCRKLPFVRDIFDVLSDTDCDYFVFVNSDILVTHHLIDMILTTRPSAVPVNRVDVHPIESIRDNIIPYRMEVFGIDAFVFNKKWYLEHSNMFEEFLLGAPWFDHHFAGIMKCMTNNKLGNTWPAMLLHEMHPKNWSFDSVETQYNSKIFNASKFIDIRTKFDDYLHGYLKIKRNNGFILECDAEELAKEMEAFAK